jgi:metal-responsive CopG/Arc/MetJ family transcriptional regulator
MAAVKTAISLDADLFREADRLARQMRIPRSRLLSLALREFVRERRNRELLDELNRAYATPPNRVERRLLQEAKRLAGRRLKPEW